MRNKISTFVSGNPVRPTRETQIDMVNDNELWVFLSHSNADFDKVRILRNKMEEAGMRPLMFFLKSLETDEEVFELIKREIDVRPRFFLCQSENARKSRWVQKEVEYILSKERQYITVDLNDPASFDEKIREMRCRSQVFLSYSIRNRNIESAVSEALRQNESKVFVARDEISSGHFQDTIANAISNTLDKGWFVPIITEEYLKSEMCCQELATALNEAAQNKKNRIVPIYVDHSEWMDPLFDTHLSDLGWFSFDSGDIERSAQEFAKHLNKINLQLNA